MATATRKAKTKPVFNFSPVADEEAAKLLAVKRAKKSEWLNVVKDFLAYHEQNPETTMVELQLDSHDVTSASSGLYNALRSARNRGELHPVDVRTREIDGEKRVFIMYNEDSVNNQVPESDAE